MIATRALQLQLRHASVSRRAEMKWKVLHLLFGGGA